MIKVHQLESAESNPPFIITSIVSILDGMRRIMRRNIHQEIEILVSDTTFNKKIGNHD